MQDRDLRAQARDFLEAMDKAVPMGTGGVPAYIVERMFARPALVTNQVLRSQLINRYGGQMVSDIYNHVLDRMRAVDKGAMRVYTNSWFGYALHELPPETLNRALKYFMDDFNKSGQQGVTGSQLPYTQYRQDFEKEKSYLVYKDGITHAEKLELLDRFIQYRGHINRAALTGQGRDVVSCPEDILAGVRNGMASMADAEHAFNAMAKSFRYVGNSFKEYADRVMAEEKEREERRAADYAERARRQTFWLANMNEAVWVRFDVLQTFKDNGPALPSGEFFGIVVPDTKKSPYPYIGVPALEHRIPSGEAVFVRYATAAETKKARQMYKPRRRVSLE